MPFFCARKGSVTAFYPPKFLAISLSEPVFARVGSVLKILSSSGVKINEGVLPAVPQTGYCDCKVLLINPIPF